MENLTTVATTAVAKVATETATEIKMVNLTPHAITFVNAEGNVARTVTPSGSLARVSCKTVTVGEIAGIPVTETVYGEVEGLPSPQENTIYIVSALVAQRCTGRTDVFVPSEQIRDDQGRVIGCRSLGRVSKGNESIRGQQIFVVSGALAENYGYCVGAYADEAEAKKDYGNIVEAITIK